jgi:hypothetical protein
MFINANPKHRSVRMANHEFTDAVKTYLGLPVRKEQTHTTFCPIQKCKDKQKVTHSVPVHDFRCECTKGARTSKHNTFTHAFQRFLLTFSKMLDAPPTIEQWADKHLPTQNYKEGDELNAAITKSSCVRFDAVVQINNKKYLIDYTLKGADLVTKDMADALKVPTDAYAMKIHSYKNSLPNNYFSNSPNVLTPVAFSVLGKGHPKSLKFLRSMALALSGGDTKKFSITNKRLLETLSVALWKGNSLLLNQYKHRSAAARLELARLDIATQPIG